MPIKTDREYRDMTLSVVDIDDDQEQEEQKNEKVVRGYASTFNEPYTLFEDDSLVYQEQVDRDAFSGTDMTDVIMQYNHEGRVFARTSNDTLSISTDDKGLLIEANLGGTEIGRNLYEEIQGGYTNKMSFGFTVDADDESRDEDSDGRIRITRTIKRVRKLYDVSAVSIPANDATSISVRSLADGVISKLQAERLEKEALELRRKKMLMRAKLL